MQKRENGKTVLYSKDGRKKLGTYGSKAEADKRERQVNYWKNQKKGGKK